MESDPQQRHVLERLFTAMRAIGIGRWGCDTFLTHAMLTIRLNLILPLAFQPACRGSDSASKLHSSKKKTRHHCKSPSHASCVSVLLPCMSRSAIAVTKPSDALNPPKQQQQQPLQQAQHQNTASSSSDGVQLYVTVPTMCVERVKGAALLRNMAPNAKWL